MKEPVLVKLCACACVFLALALSPRQTDTQTDMVEKGEGAHERRQKTYFRFKSRKVRNTRKKNAFAFSLFVNLSILGDSA